MTEATRWRLGHRPALDGVRGLAILLVFVFHLMPLTIPGGKIGVDLFFVLSGFLITTLLLEEHERGGISLRGFYTRRARRLLPALGAMLLVVGVVLAASRAWGDLASLGYVATYVANYASVAGNLAGPVKQCWSLAIEEQFYIVWPVALLLLLRFRHRAVIAGIVASTIVVVMLHRVMTAGTVSDIRTEVRADGLLAGCLLAFLFAWFGAASWKWWMYALLAAPFLVIEVLYASPVLDRYGYTIVAALFACVVAAALTCAPFARALSTPVLRWFGRISYSLYLWHYAVLWWLRGNSGEKFVHPHVVDCVLGIVLSIGLACASYRWIERPFLARAAPERMKVNAA